MTIRLTNKGAFTMIELVVGCCIFIFILFMVNKFISSVRHGFMHGTVNLERLQEARLAMTYLRRDFSSACPIIAQKDPSKIRRFYLKYPFELEGKPSTGHKSSPIQVSDSSLTFFRFTFDSPTGPQPPKVFPVSYEFNKEAHTLTRVTPDRQKVFKGFHNVVFKCYVQKSSPEIPLVHVEIEVFEEKQEKSAELGKPLALCSTLGSAFIADNLGHRYWNFTTFQED